MIEFGVLGPLVATRGRTRLELGAPMMRRTLAVLLCHEGRAVPAAVVAEAIWDGRPPPTARKTLQVYVMRLRRALGVPELVRHTPAGYLVDLELGVLDAHRFTELRLAALAALRAGDLASASTGYGRALALWRGAAYADVLDMPLAASAASGLEELRIAAAEEKSGADLGLGRYAELVADLPHLIERHPYREPLRERLILALYRSGRQSDALAAYRAAYDLLADELGVEPGAGLQQAHHVVLHGEADTVAGGTAPALLPADIARFAGRHGPLRELDACLPRPGAANPPVIIHSVTGIAGVGKTALTVRWGHRVRHRFPDGQLFADLRGFDRREPTAPVAVLRRFLRALGVAAERIPDDEDSAADMYRTLLADRSVLVVLDNARSAEQVRPLLPGSRTCLVVVTSRDTLTGLVVRDGARRLTLDVLSAADSVELVAGIAGRHRVAAEPEATAGLVRACGYLPLALRITAAVLADNPHRTVSEQLALLAGPGRLSRLEIPEDPASTLRAAFDMSYASLSPGDRRVFRMLGPAPGADLTVPAASALTGLAPEPVAAALHRLVAANLVMEPAPGRFTLHDLLREYASELAGDDDPATHRLLAFYLGQVEAATELTHPQTLGLPAAGAPASFPDAVTARQWLVTERLNILAAAEHAAVTGPQPMAWLLTVAIRAHLCGERELGDLDRLTRMALPLAEAAGDVRAQAALHYGLANAALFAGRPRDVLGPGSRGNRLARQANWAEARVGFLSNLGAACFFLGRLAEAEGHLIEALAVYDHEPVAMRRSTILNRLGTVCLLRGDLVGGTEYLEQALAGTVDANAGAYPVSVDLSLLAWARRLRGDTEAALGHAREAHDLLDSVHATHARAIVDIQVAKAMRDLGDYAGALPIASASAETLENAGDDLSCVHAWLTEATILAETGQPEAALRRLGHALDVATRLQNSNYITECELCHAVIHYGMGDRGSAAPHAERAHDRAVADGLRLLEGQAGLVLAAVRDDRALAGRARATLSATGHRAAPHPVTWLPQLTWP
ncbi:BTAD domain-containing putative transcriptional regulator [Longispora sp. K20-0274]|uniref:AfsR/SARP family transcriptional regulator n=1 Tax=Longispora sp. K20-0274 TaxID=3088255 RepID=UPI00399B9D60